MNCFISGLFGIGLLGASIATNMTSKEQTEILRRKLSPELATKYDTIVKERTALYIQGLLIGMLLAYIILLWNNPVFYSIILFIDAEIRLHA
jgi:hypothetical protein